MKNNYFKQLLTAVLMLCCTVATAFEVDGIHYYVNHDSDFDFKTAVVKRSVDDDGEVVPSYKGNVVIPETVVYEDETYTVVGIDIAAFYGCTELTSVSIPNTVTFIETYAFYGCSKLEDIKIPGSVTFVASEAFGETGWYNKQDDGLLYLDGWLLGYKGHEPASVDVLPGTKGIAHAAFAQCKELHNVTLPEGVSIICNKAFYLCENIINVEFPTTMRTIGGEAFAACHSLENVNIPNGVTTIGSEAFSGCKALMDIKIPATVTSIGASAFYGTGWYNNQPGGLVYLGDWLLYHKGDLRGEITIADGIKHIGVYALAYSEYLTGVVIPNSVISIEDGAFGNTAIKEITIPNSVTSIGSSAFSGCSGLTSIEIPSSVTSIGDYAFASCTSLESVTIPGSVPKIGQSTFIECVSLKNLYIEDCNNTLLIVDDDLFQASLDTLYLGRNIYCSNSYGDYDIFIDSKLKSLTIGSGLTDLSNINLRTSYESIVVTDGNKVYDSREGCNAIIETASNTLILGCKNTVIPNGVEIIGEEAFEGCDELTKINIPGSVKEIGECAFVECESLETLTIGEGVETIAYGAFGYCISLKEVIIPNSVVELGKYAFLGCEALECVYIGGGISRINEATFGECNALKSIYVMGETPAVVEVSNFTEEQFASVELNVPAGSLAAYQAADVWKEFLNIKEFDATGIEELKSENGKVQTTYDLQGRKVDTLNKGLYIIDGKKVLVK